MLQLPAASFTRTESTRPLRGCGKLTCRLIVTGAPGTGTDTAVPVPCPGSTTQLAGLAAPHAGLRKYSAPTIAGGRPPGVATSVAFTITSRALPAAVTVKLVMVGAVLSSVKSVSENGPQLPAASLPWTKNLTVP